MTGTAPEAAGDLLLSRGADPRSAPRRAGTAKRSALWEADGWTLSADAAGPGWRGLPLRELSVPRGRAWLLGELFGAGPDPARVVTGEASAAALDGHFLLWAWDEDRRAWTVWTDRFGTLHAYRGAAGEAVAVGTHHRAVASLASARSLDWIGLAGFFGAGHFPEDRTHWEDVRILRPARRHAFGEDGVVAAERYWRWTHAPAGADFDRAVDAFAGTFAAVVADHADAGRVAVPISGGLDSRCLVAAVPDPGRTWALSYGYGPDSRETRIAARVAAARGLPFSPYAVPEYLFNRLDAALAATEGFQDVAQSRQLGLAEEIRARADVVLGGHWGDVWLDTLGLDGVPEAGAERVRDHVLALTYKPSDWLDDRLCRPGLGGDPAAARAASVEADLPEYDSIDDPDFRVKAFKTDHWSFRWTLASVRAYRPAAVPRLPFYDTRLTDLVSTFPSGFLRGRRLQIEYLKRHAPDLARVAWQARDADLFGGRVAGARAAARRAIRKARRRLLGERAIQRNWEVQFLSPAGWRALEARLLAHGAPLHELVPAVEVRGLLERLRARPEDGGLGYQVSMLLTFAVWLEREAGGGR